MGKENKNYATLNRVIGDAIVAFDNIYDAIASKSVPGFTTGGQGSAVSLYSTAIENYLYRVQGKDKSSLTLDVIPDKSGQTSVSNLSSSSVLYDSNAVTLTTSGLSQGYYDDKSVIKVTFTGTSVTASGSLNAANSGWTAGENDYTYGIDGKIVSGIKINKATIAASTNALQGTNLAINNNDLTLGLVTGMSEILNADGYATVDDDEKENYYEISVSSDLSTSGTITPQIFATVTPGYISNVSEVTVTNPTTALGTGGLGVSGSLASHIYIKRAVIDMGDANNVGLSITDNGGSISKPALEAGDSAANYYDISATFGGASYPNARITEGYTLGSASLSLSLGSETKHLYVRKGAIAGTTREITLDATPSAGITGDGGVSYSGADKVTIAVAVHDMTNTTLPITPGYIKDTSVSVAYSGGTKEISLKKAAGSLVGTGVDAEISGTPIETFIASGLTADNYYEINSTISGTLSINSAASHLGYLSSFSDFSGTISDATGTTYYVRKGVDQNGTWNATSTEVTSGNALNITVSTTHVTPLGYYPSNSSRTWTKTETIPAAQLRWHEGTDGDEGYLEVSTPGYLAADRTFVFGGGSYEGGSESGESIAVAKATLTNSTVLSSGSTVPTGAYEITIAKDSSTDAGYISATKGAIQFANNLKYYVAKGIFAQTITSSATVGNVTWNTAANSGAGAFTIVATPTITKQTATASTEGYINPETDITITPVAGNAVTKQLTLGAIGGTVGNVTFTEETTGTTALTSSTGSYGVNISISADVAPEVTREGYVSKTHVESTTATVTGSKVIKLKDGSIGATALTGTLTPQFDSTNRTISISRNLLVSTAATEGYIKDGNHTSKTENITSNTLTLDAADVTLSGVATATLNSSGVVLHTAASGTGKTLANNYLAITPSGTFSASVDSLTEGYLKESTQIHGFSGQAIPSTNITTKYVEKFIGTGTGGTGNGSTASYTRSGASQAETVWHFKIGAASDGYGELFIDTKEKYSQQAILVDLDDDAAGDNVLNDLDDLAARLTGQLPRATTSV